MRQLVAAAGLSLVAGFAFGDAAIPPQRHTVSLPTNITAPKQETRDELQRNIDEFFREKLRRLTPAESNADYSYLSFSVDSRGGLTSSFGVRNQAPSSFPDGCAKCDMEEKLTRIIEKTLFRHAHLYTPVALRDCSHNAARTRVKITVAPNSAGGVEPKFFYRARLIKSDSESDVTLSPYDENEIDDSSAWFDAFGTADEEFLIKCSLKQLSDFVLVPHAAAPVDTRTTNKNATSAAH